MKLSETALAVLERALGVLGVRDGAEPEEDELPHARHVQYPGQHEFGEDLEAEAGLDRAFDGACADRHDEHDPEQAEEDAVVGVVVGAAFLDREQPAAEPRDPGRQRERGDAGTGRADADRARRDLATAQRVEVPAGGTAAYEQHDDADDREDDDRQEEERLVALEVDRADAAAAARRAACRRR